MVEEEDFIDINYSTASPDVKGFDYENDLLKDLKIRRQALNLFVENFKTDNSQEIKDSTVTAKVSEEKYGIALMVLNGVGLIKTVDWSSPSARELDELDEKRSVEVIFYSTKIKPFLNQCQGKLAIIRMQALDLIVQQIKNIMSPQEWFGYFLSKGISSRLMQENMKLNSANLVDSTKLISDVFLTLSSNQSDHKVFFSILEELCHPVMHKGNAKKAAVTAKKISELISLDGYTLFSGKIRTISEVTILPTQVSDNFRKQMKPPGDLSFIISGNEGQLRIPNFKKPIFFQGDRCAIVSYFYNDSDRKIWKTYTDIQRGISKQLEGELIRKAIEKINVRFEKFTNGKYGELIKRGKEGEEPNSRNKYRWNL